MCCESGKAASCLTGVGGSCWGGAGKQLNGLRASRAERKEGRGSREILGELRQKDIKSQRRETTGLGPKRIPESSQVS